MPDPGPDTIIGNDVWIGQGATILPGAKLGDGVIVGAGSVDAGTAPHCSVVAGNKARVIRPRFEDTAISRLKAIAWWDLPIDMILRSQAEIAGSDFDALEAINHKLRD